MSFSGVAQVISVNYSSVSRSNEPGWLVGTLNGKSGLIPENYVEILN